MQIASLAEWATGVCAFQVHVRNDHFRSKVADAGKQYADREDVPAVLSRTLHRAFFVPAAEILFPLATAAGAGKPTRTLI